MIYQSVLGYEIQRQYYRGKCELQIISPTIYKTKKKHTHRKTYSDICKIIIRTLPFPQRKCGVVQIRKLRYAMTLMRKAHVVLFLFKRKVQR